MPPSPLPKRKVYSLGEGSVMCFGRLEGVNIIEDQNYFDSDVICFLFRNALQCTKTSVRQYRSSNAVQLTNSSVVQSTNSSVVLSTNSNVLQSPKQSKTFETMKTAKLAELID